MIFKRFSSIYSKRNAPLDEGLASMRVIGALSPASEAFLTPLNDYVPGE